MKFYLDFEANINEEIIPIGCVSAAGARYHGFVHPTTKLDRKIKELTGISQEDVDNAPSIDGAIRMFFIWLQKQDGVGDDIKFITWGKGDKRFLKASSLVTADPAAAHMLNFISSHIIDIMPLCAKKFNRSSMGLRSAYATMTKIIPNENHNALDDAEMTKYIDSSLSLFAFDGEFVKVHKKNFKYGSLEDRYGGRDWDMPIMVENSKGKRWNFKHLYECLAIMPNAKKGHPKKRF